MSEVDISKSNSYLSFNLGDEEFAAHVGKVLNILEMIKITEVPMAPTYMKGVINLRGAVLPVIDTRIKFGMPATVYTPNTCIVVLDIDMDGDSVHVGALVDSVQAVLEIPSEEILPPPSIGSRYKSEFIEGVANIEDRFVMLLNMDMVFSSVELAAMKDTTEETARTIDVEQIN